MRPGQDWAFPYYRDRALCLALGVTPYEMLLQAVGAKYDPASGGRQMPSHWGHRDYNIVSQASPTGTQCLQAVGCAEAGRLYERLTDIPGRESKFVATIAPCARRRTPARASLESLNTACTRQLPAIYLVEDNGYAIRCPRVQTAGGDA
jgi:2-oxoisovalerate dehydrogenase E1 component